jgi:hypothetical protein
MSSPSLQDLGEGFALVAKLGDGYLSISFPFSPCERNDRIVRA